MADNGDQGTPEMTGDAIVDAVVLSSKPYANRNYRKYPPIKLGGETDHVVTFTGQDNDPHVRFVHEGSGQPVVYDDLNKLILYHDRAPLHDERYIFTLTVCIGFGVCLIAMILFGALSEKPQGFQAFSSLTMLIAGYLFGAFGRQSGRATEDAAKKISN